MGKPVRRPCLQIYIFFILEFSFWVPNGGNGSWEERKHSHSRVTLEGPAGRFFSLRVRWFTIWLAGAQSRHREMPALSPGMSHFVLSFVFSWHHLLWVKKVCGGQVICLVCFPSFMVTCRLFFQSCLFFQGCMECDYSDLNVQNTGHNLHAS